MFERFTDRARRVVVVAQETARQFNSESIDVAHLVDGLLVEEFGVGAVVLNNLGITLESWREAAMITDAKGKPPAGHIPFTPAAKKILELSLREALQLGHNYIGTEHILLGIVREGKAVYQFFLNHNVDLAIVRQEVIKILASGHENPAKVVALALEDIMEVVKDHDATVAYARGEWVLQYGEATYRDEKLTAVFEQFNRHLEAEERPEQWRVTLTDEEKEFLLPALQAITESIGDWVYDKYARTIASQIAEKVQNAENYKE